MVPMVHWSIQFDAELKIVTCSSILFDEIIITIFFDAIVRKGIDSSSRVSSRHGTVCNTRGINASYLVAPMLLSKRGHV
jgi:hypothetical protein